MPDSDDDVAALRRYAETGDSETRDRLLERYRGLALYHARRFADRGVEQDDLEQVAMIGLLKALDRFDPDREAALSTYASRTIDGELKRHFRDRGWATHVPRGIRDLSVSVNVAADELTKELGHPPRPSEVATRLGVDTEAVLEALDAATAFRTAPLGEDVHEMTGSTDPTLTAVPDRLLVDEILAELPERERSIVRLRFYGRLTQTEIAEQIGMSQMHVSRLLRQSLLALRDAMARRGIDRLSSVDDIDDVTG